MIALLVFLFVSIVLAVEAISLWGITRPLKVSFDVDTTLVEPDEIITLRYSVSNPYPLPRLFVGFTLFFDPDVKVREDEAFCRSHVQASDMGARVDYRFFLGVHRAFTGKVRFSVSRRGLRELGRYFVETGEFLGLFPIVNSDPIDKKIVCTAEKCAVDELAFPGGELGDLSARRFILDDPTMLLGYREYTGREPMKQISWKQTAKVGRLRRRGRGGCGRDPAAADGGMSEAGPHGHRAAGGGEGALCPHVQRRSAVPARRDRQGASFLPPAPTGPLQAHPLQHLRAPGGTLRPPQAQQLQLHRDRPCRGGGAEGVDRLSGQPGGKPAHRAGPRPGVSLSMDRRPLTDRRKEVRA